MPAASILQVLKLKKPQNISDETIMIADIAVKARIQVASFITDVLSKRLPKKEAQKLAVILCEGRWTHDFPFTVQFAQQLGLPITTQMPRIVYELMDLYPQANARRPSVVYVPIRGFGESKGGLASPGPANPGK